LLFFQYLVIFFQTLEVYMSAIEKQSKFSPSTIFADRAEVKQACEDTQVREEDELMAAIAAKSQRKPVNNGPSTPQN